MTTHSLGAAGAPIPRWTASVQPVPMLVTALRADALASGAVALWQLAFSGSMAALAHLPRPLLVGTGAFCVGYVVLLLVLAAARRVRWPLLALVVAGNGLWAAGCLELAFSEGLAPTALGQVYLIAQAAAVLALSAWQASGLWRSPSIQ